MTFTRKTIVLITAIVASILLITNTFVYVMFKEWTMDSRQSALDAQLSEFKHRMESVEFIPHILRPGSGLSQLFSPDLSGLRSSLDAGESLYLSNARGKVIAELPAEGSGSEDVGEIMLEAGNGEAVMNGKPVMYASVEVVLPAFGRTDLWLIQSTAAADEAVGKIRSLLLYSSALGIAFAAISAHVIARRTIRPVRQITQKVQHMDAMELTQRLSLPPAKDEVRELAATFNHLLDRVHAVRERERQFVADASHELKTPLAAIEGYTKLIQRWGKTKPDALEESIGYMTEETGRMKELITQMLLASELEQPGEADETADLVPVIEQIVRAHRILYPDLIIKLDLSVPSVHVKLPLFYLQQLLQNVVSNACKFTPPGSQVSVIADDSSQSVDITVTDTGIGIPFEDQPRIFDRFYRVDRSRSRSAGGSGLGLAIVKQILDAFGGAVRLKSQPGVGTTIKIGLPKA